MSDTYELVDRLLEGHFVEDEERIMKPVLSPDGRPLTDGEGQPMLKLDHVIQRKRYVPPSPLVVVLCMQHFFELDAGTVRAVISAEMKNHGLTEAQLQALAAVVFGAEVALKG